MLVIHSQVLQPVSNQYNIIEKIKEANQELYNGQLIQRQSQPKVRFRDNKLVDFEPEDVMEVKQSDPNRKEDIESDDDECIDDETLNITPIEENIVDETTIEIEDICERIDANEIEELEVVESDLNKDFNDEDNISDKDEETHLDVPSSESQKEIKCKVDKPKKKIFRPTKVNPIEEQIVCDDQNGNTSSGKTCCQYKKTDEYKQKLPKYNGFKSNYGLSKEEIEKRKYIQLRQQQQQQFKELQKMEQKELLARVNEEAFAKWLYKKMRNPIKKSTPVNMFDVKLSVRKRKPQ
ncbi:CLUMA_CG014469, isoform A [Clunio marinus]|uniref:CLUMA_CG014469, isoform A n=1 Tax=Clunio marinus TaxID=568069 RepID=A0A1J1IPZ3_9DIPT|nr:CLUMA_CG014469, isoform A [Clunio marinus]